MVNTSYLKSCRTTQDLESSEIIKAQNNVKTSWKYNLEPRLPPETKILSILAKHFLKIDIEPFP